MRFREFLLKEDRESLAERIGDILSALQNFAPIAEKRSQASLSAAKNIVAQIRKITRNTDPRDILEQIEKLVDIGVMLSNAVDGKGDKTLPQATDIAIAAIRGIVDKLGAPINTIASGDSPKPEDAVQVSKPIKPARAVAPPSGQQTGEPTSPGSLPPDKQPPLGGSTGDLKTL